MQLAYEPLADFPPFAWAAFMRPGEKTVTVWHGPWVETQPGFFIEGAWSGEFSEGRMQDADTVFGSGATVTEGGITFVTSMATTDFIYFSERPHLTAIANSLPLLLAVIEDELLPAQEGYSRINMSILKGIRHYEDRIPTRHGHVHRLIHANLRLDQDGLRRIEKPLPPHFPDFTAYRDFLRMRMGQLLENARHGARKMPLRVYSTQSKGYDSTAVNALAAPLGVDMVFTSARSKESGSFYQGQQAELPSDDGTPICEVLGLPCTTIDRLGFRENLDNEQYYWAGLDNNQDLNLHQIQSMIEGPSLLLTGNLGEMWYTAETVGATRMSTFNDELIRWDQGGHGLGEVRLKAGFVQVAVPFIGARRSAEILQITNSAEMDAFRMGGTYDRPIARRIAEEAGVPRDMFGQKKLASIVHLPTPNLPVTGRLRQAFFRHLRRQHLLGPIGIALLPAVQGFNNFIYWKRPNRYFQNRGKHPVLWSLGRGWARIFGRPPRFHMLWGRIDSYLYAFCVNGVREEYAAHLGDKKSAHHAGD